MAFQVGDIKISGTIDDLSFYNSVFGWLVRQKGGPTRKQFKKSPAFARARENSDEFTLCSQAAASFRRLIIKHTGTKDKKLYHRLMKLMRLLANTDQASLRGQRDPNKGIHSAKGKLLLKGFEITGGISLFDILITVGYIKETVHEKDPLPITKKYSAPIKRRRVKANAFRPPDKASGMKQHCKINYRHRHVMRYRLVKGSSVSCRFNNPAMPPESKTIIL